MRNVFFINTEWVHIALDKVVLKTANPTKVHQPSPVGSRDRFAPKMIDADSIAKTQKLLDRAIALAWRDIKSSRRPPDLTRTRWVWRLAGAYHSSRHTTRLMEEARDRFAASGRQSLAQWAAQKAREEAGHDRLALLDIQSMGYDAEAVVQALVPSPIQALVDYFFQSVQTTDPIGCVGFFYTAERLGTFQGEEYIQSVQALLPPGTHATRWLRIHSGVGAEVKHVEETIEVVAQLTPQECIRVARACYETALLRFTPPKEGYISDSELQNVLKPLELNTCYECN
ncbi:MAG: hypothetical protein KME31_12290 [Tolypothrix carrinoi HA7290-LM1]|jgi:hypothetical protein|nr:hypothetical protein [Tolypothrix carrinoi HA7290-LM1]